MSTVRVAYFDASTAPEEAISWAATALNLLACQAKRHVGLTSAAISALGAWPMLTGLCVPTGPPQLYAALMSLLGTCSVLPAVAQRLAQLGLGTVLLAPPSLRERLGRRAGASSGSIESDGGDEAATPPPAEGIIGGEAACDSPEMLPLVVTPCQRGHAELPWALLLCRLSRHSAFHLHLGLELSCQIQAANAAKDGVVVVGGKNGPTQCTASEDAKASAATLVTMLQHCFEDSTQDSTVSVTTALLHTLRLLTNVAPTCLDEMPCEHFAAAVRKAERCSATPRGAPLANELLALLSELRLVRGPLVRAWSAHVRERGTLWERWLFDRMAAMARELRVGEKGLH
mmetsp:Transcript_100570/g.192820  ORF Transcript_100570/g.192820 Transcript_100570/m.192820 type:complete len:344 (+) Transcript_100570:2-1033(+)